MSATPLTIPNVGDGATFCVGSDRYPATVISVVRSKSGRTITVTIQSDSFHAISGSGHDGSAEYAYERNPDGATRIFVSRDGDRFRMPNNSYCHVSFGYRNAYRDPHF